MKNQKLDLLRLLQWIISGFLILCYSYVLIVNSLLLQTTRGSRFSMILFILSGIVALPINLLIGKKPMSSLIRIVLFLIFIITAIVMY